MNGKEEFMWTIIGTNISIHVSDPNILGLRPRHCCVTCLCKCQSFMSFLYFSCFFFPTTPSSKFLEVSAFNFSYWYIFVLLCLWSTNVNNFLSLSLISMTPKLFLMSFIFNFILMSMFVSILTCTLAHPSTMIFYENPLFWSI